MAQSRNWFASDGAAARGPFGVHEILALVAAEQLPEDTWVWQPAWQEARPLATVREFHSQHASSEAEDVSPEQEWCDWLDQACDTNELVAMTLQGLVLATNASLGLAYRRHRTGDFVATAAVGLRGAALLGSSASAKDPALTRAKLGPVVLPHANASRAGTACLNRLGELDGSSVALTPLFVGSKLLAVLELGRSDHPFRNGDSSYLRGTARTASDRAGRLALSAAH